MFPRNWQAGSGVEKKIPHSPPSTWENLSTLAPTPSLLNNKQDDQVWVLTTGLHFFFSFLIRSLLQSHFSPTFIPVVRMVLPLSLPFIGHMVTFHGSFSKDATNGLVCSEVSVRDSPKCTHQRGKLKRYMIEPTYCIGNLRLNCPLLFLFVLGPHLGTENLSWGLACKACALALAAISLSPSSCPFLPLLFFFFKASSHCLL